MTNFKSIFKGRITDVLFTSALVYILILIVTNPSAMLSQQGLLAGAFYLIFILLLSKFLDRSIRQRNRLRLAVLSGLLFIIHNVVSYELQGIAINSGFFAVSFIGGLQVAAITFFVAMFKGIK